MIFVEKQMDKKVSCLVVLLAATIAVYCSSAVQAKDEPVNYDPSKCSTDPHGMVYFALGRRVFRQPMENLGYIQLAAPEYMANLPPPPKPDEPQGCPDHPLQGIGFPLHGFSAMPEDKIADDVRRLGDSAIGELDNTTANLNQQGNETVYNKICKEGGASGEVAPGFNACWYEHAVDPENRGRHGMFVQAKPDAYQDPHGGKFTMWCDVDWGNKKNDVYVCRVDYNLYSGLHNVVDQSYGVSIDYRFNTEKVPFKDVIALDQELRRRITVAEVKDYPWPDLKLSKGEGK